MSVREYIGARYVPLFADPIEWDNTKTYEPLTIVYYQGNSYTSRQAVPTGIAITNEAYWALTGNYNAQIEAYRTEVQNYAEQVAGFDTAIDALEDALPISDFNENSTVSDAIEAIDDKIGGNFTAQNSVNDAINVIDGKIGGSFTAQNSVNDAIEATNVKLDDYIGSNNTFSIGENRDYANFYIDVVNGDDDNTGHYGHPVKSITKVFELIKSENVSDVYIHFMSAGNFTIQNTIISNGQIHFITHTLSSGIVNITFDTLRGYNSYFHFSSETNGQCRVSFTNENHFDNCCVWAYKIEFTFNSAPNHNYCDFHFIDCTISTMIQIVIKQSRMHFGGITTITQLADFNAPILFTQHCDVLFDGTVNLNFIGRTEHAMMRFDDGILFFVPTTLTISKPSSLKYGLTILRSIAVVAPALNSTLTNNVTDSIFEGSQSIIKNSGTNTILN